MSLVDASGGSVIMAGLEISSRDPLFLATVGVHVLLGLICAITGFIAMLSPRAPGGVRVWVRSTSGVWRGYA